MLETNGNSYILNFYSCYVLFHHAHKKTEFSHTLKKGLNIKSKF